MTTTVSPKYQIVIPKAVRRQLNIKPGQKMQVEAGLNSTILVRHVTEPSSFAELSKYAGVINSEDTAWGKQKLDPAQWIRQQRDEDWH